MRPENWARALVPIGLAAMVAGSLGPWVAHANAGMSLGVVDLVEFTKFMARAGLTAVVREWFYLPLLAGLVGSALWSARQLSGIKLAVAGGAALWALVVLPPYPYLLTAYRSPEDRLSLWMGIAALGAILMIAWLGQRIPQRLAMGALVLLAIGSLAPAVWQFAQLMPPLSLLYGAPVQMGWGLVVTLAGGGLVVLGGLAGLRPAGD